eukprot:3362049-Alexandrium_andersonii.AAC.1
MSDSGSEESPEMPRCREASARGRRSRRRRRRASRPRGRAPGSYTHPDAADDMQCVDLGGR